MRLFLIIIFFFFFFCAMFVSLRAAMISHMTMTSRLMMFDRPLALAYLQIFDAKNSTQLTSSRSRFSFFIYAILQARIYSFLIRSLQVLSLAVIGNLMKEAEREDRKSVV